MLPFVVGTDADKKQAHLHASACTGHTYREIYLYVTAWSPVPPTVYSSRTVIRVQVPIIDWTWTGATLPIISRRTWSYCIPDRHSTCVQRATNLVAAYEVYLADAI